MTYYILKLVLMLALVVGLAVGSLFLLKRYHELQGPKGKKLLQIVETLAMSPSQKLAVVAFGDKHILLAISRSGIVRLSQQQVSPSPNEDRSIDDGASDEKD